MLPMNVSLAEVIRRRPVPKQEYWPAYLEKAFAKRLHGTYHALTGGNSTLALTALTGGICIKTKIKP